MIGIRGLTLGAVQNVIQNAPSSSPVTEGPTLGVLIVVPSLFVAAGNSLQVWSSRAVEEV